MHASFCDTRRQTTVTTTDVIYLSIRLVFDGGVVELHEGLSI